MNDLYELLHDAVDGIEPDDRIDAIRARTASPARAARPWWYTAGGVVLATASTVAAFAVLDDTSGPARHHDHGAMTMPDTQLVAAYFIGDTPAGPRLFREFDRVPAGDPLQVALDRIQEAPADPDYRTAWDPGTLRSATVRDGEIVVDASDVTFGDDLTMQQLVHTLQAAVGQRLPVSFSVAGSRPSTPMQARTAVLSPVSISDPAEGNEYEGSMIARGRAGTDQDTVRWQLRDDDRVVRDGAAPVADGRGLCPWETTVDLGGLEPGTYVFVVRADDMDFTTQTVDTRTISVR